MQDFTSVRQHFALLHFELFKFWLITRIICIQIYGKHSLKSKKNNYYIVWDNLLCLWSKSYTQQEDLRLRFQENLVLLLTRCDLFPLKNTWMIRVIRELMELGLLTLCFSNCTATTTWVVMEKHRIFFKPEGAFNRKDQCLYIH